MMRPILQHFPARTSPNDLIKLGDMEDVSDGTKVVHLDAYPAPALSPEARSRLVVQAMVPAGPQNSAPATIARAYQVDVHFPERPGAEGKVRIGSYDEYTDGSGVLAIEAYPAPPAGASPRNRIIVSSQAVQAAPPPAPRPVIPPTPSLSGASSVAAAAVGSSGAGSR